MCKRCLISSETLIPGKGTIDVTKHRMFEQVDGCGFITSADSRAALKQSARQHHDTSHPTTKFRPQASFLPLATAEPQEASFLPLATPQSSSSSAHVQKQEVDDEAGGLFPTLSDRHGLPGQHTAEGTTVKGKPKNLIFCI